MFIFYSQHRQFTHRSFDIVLVEYMYSSLYVSSASVLQMIAQNAVTGKLF